MARIRITKITGEDAPEWVREAWIGCEMEKASLKVDTQFDFVPAVARKAGKDGKPPFEPGETIEIFLVRQDLALLALRGKLPAAAHWYGRAGYPQPCGYFSFESHDADVLN